MKKEYKDHIGQISYKEAWGCCEKRAGEMKVIFPELILCKGWYFDAIWNEDREHHWLKTDSGEIVDPTAKQFPTNGMTNFYTEYKKGDKVRVGVCAYCGEDIMRLPEEVGTFPTVCSQTCHEKYVTYLMG